MFLTVKQNTIPDFLSALGFIVPKGLDMSYILTPSTISNGAVNTLENIGFKDTPITPIHKDEDIRYLKKDPTESFSFSAQNRITTDPSLLSSEFPKQATVEDPGLYEPTVIKNSKRAIQIKEVKDSLSDRVFIIKENFCGIPKNTLFAFSKKEEI